MHGKKTKAVFARKDARKRKKARLRRAVLMVGNAEESNLNVLHRHYPKNPVILQG